MWYQTGDIPACSLELRTVPPCTWSRAANPGRKTSGRGFSPPLNVGLDVPALVQSLHQGALSSSLATNLSMNLHSSKRTLIPLAPFVFPFSSLTTGCHCNSRHEEASPGGLRRGHTGSQTFLTVMGNDFSPVCSPRQLNVFSCCVLESS